MVKKPKDVPTPPRLSPAEREAMLVEKITRLEEKIAPVVAQLGQLRLELRSLRSTRASALSRAARNKDRDARIRKEAKLNADDKYRRIGDPLVRTLAEKNGLSTRRILQILRPSDPKGG